MKDFTYITNSSPEFIENLYHDFINNPESVDPELRKFFEGFDFAITAHATNGSSTMPVVEELPTNVTLDSSQLAKEFAVYNLILAYRKKGHLAAKTNPIRERKDREANLDLKIFWIKNDDLNKEFESGKFLGLGKSSLGKYFGSS